MFRTTIKTNTQFVLWLTLNNLAAKFIFPVLLFIFNGDDDCLLVYSVILSSQKLLFAHKEQTDAILHAILKHSIHHKHSNELIFDRS